MEHKGRAAPRAPQGGKPRCWETAHQFDVAQRLSGRSDCRPSSLFTTLRKTISESSTTSCLRRSISCLQRLNSRWSSVSDVPGWLLLLSFMLGPSDQRHLPNSKG